MVKTKDIISKLKFKVFKEYPFYADLSLNREHTLVPKETGIWFATTGDKILYSEMVLDFTFEENLFAYLHELKHIALKHIEMMKKYDDRDRFLMNIATDIIVNELNREDIEPTVRLEKEAIFKEKFKELKNVDVKKLNSLEIYDILFKKFKSSLNKMNMPNPDKTSNLNDLIKDFIKKNKQFSDEIDKLKKSGAITETEANVFKRAYKDYYFGKVFDKLPEKKKKEILEKIKEDVLSGYVNAKTRGIMSAGMENIVNHLFKKVRDWKKILRDEILDTIKGDFTWGRVSDNLQSLHIAGFKQIGNLPSLDDTYSLPEIVVGIDVSGSISDEDYKQFMDEIYSIFKTTNVKRYEIVMWETEVTKVIKGVNGQYKKVLEWLKRRKGYGGTELRSFLKYCDRKHTNNKIAVILTDGYVEDDLDRNEFRNFKKVIFVLTEDCDYENIAKLKSNKIRVLRMGIGE